jgi:hypothetical protein
MDDKLDFKQLQTKLYFNYHNDGIIDMTVGLSAVGFAIFMATELVALLMLAWLPLLVYIPLKQGLTRPRLGFVRFTSQRASVSRYALLVLLGLVVLGGFIALNIFTRSEMPAGYVSWMRQYHMAVYGGILGLVAVGAALFSGLKRFYAYGLLAFLVPAVAAWLDLPTFVPVLAVGLLLAGNGLRMAIRFVRSYPTQAQED